MFIHDYVNDDVIFVYRYGKHWFVKCLNKNLLKTKCYYTLLFLDYMFVQRNESAVCNEPTIFFFHEIEQDLRFARLLLPTFSRTWNMFFCMHFSVDACCVLIAGELPETSGWNCTNWHYMLGIKVKGTQPVRAEVLVLVYYRYKNDARQNQII